MMLAGWLSHPYVRHILPSVVRQPLTLETATTTGTFGETASFKDLLGVWDSYAGGRSKAQGRFESQPISCAEYGRIRFEVGGELRAQGQSLVLRPLDGRRDIPVRPPFFSDGWTAISVRCPPTPFAVVAVDASPTTWFAFRQPAEMGWASSGAEAMIQQSWTLGVMAALVTITAIVAGWPAKGGT
jgi:hypothetical protein